VNCKWKTHYACSVAALALTATLAPARANAQAQAPAPAPAPATTSADAQVDLGAESTNVGAETEEAAIPELPPPEPTPAPPPADEKPLFRWYGIIKPTVLFGNAVESFGNTNFTAVTAAANPRALGFPDQVDSTGLSFQVGQTRFGLAVGEGLPVKGQIELDFVDFGKSSPAQAALPRLRQAFAEWTFAEGQKLTLGQLWDLFSPLNSHAYDLVGGMFQAGNSGFMRHQIMWLGTFGNLEAGAAIGMTAQNNTNTLNSIEYGRVPTFSARVGYRKDKTLFAGVSLIASRLSFAAPGPGEETTMAFAGNAFLDTTFGALNLRAEAYGGQNLGNLGALTLSFGNAAEDYKEVGGWVSAKYSFAEVHAVHAIAGAALVVNSDDVLPGYTGDLTATPAVPYSRVGISGIKSNVCLRLGYAYTAYKGFSLVTEPYLFFTSHELAAADETAGFDGDVMAYGLQLGGLYTF
jgi:hypothetical protein